MGVECRPESECRELVSVKISQAVLATNLENINKQLSKIDTTVTEMFTTVSQFQGAGKAGGIFGKLVAPVLGAATGFIAGHMRF